jgi:hypothetical protein
MNMKKRICICLIIVNISFSAAVYADNGIADFDKDWAVNFFINYNMGIFKGFDSPQYITDKPWDVGFGLRYKSISAKLSVSLSLDEPFNLWSFDVEADSYFNKIYYQVYFKRYPNLSVEDSDAHSNLDIHASGLMAIFLQNHENHSLSSVTKLDKKQNEPSGSFLYGFGLFHSSLYSTTGTMERFDSRQHLLYFGPGIGYSYIWVFKNDIFLNTSILFFASPGVNINTGNWLFVPQLEPNITVGHHNKTWSINLIMKDNAKFIFWKKDEIDILTLVSITIMFSKRF